MIWKDIFIFVIIHNITNYLIFYKFIFLLNYELRFKLFRFLTRKIKKMRQTERQKMASLEFNNLSYQISSYIEKNILMFEEDNSRVVNLIDNPLMMDLKHIILEEENQMFLNRAIYGFANVQTFQKLIYMFVFIRKMYELGWDFVTIWIS